MTIRTRLTLWYAAILFSSLLLISLLSYHELVVEKATGTREYDEQDDGLGDVARIILWCGIPAVILGLGGGWWLMRKAMGPVTALTEAAAKINESNLRQQLPRTGNGDELDQLTTVFNAMTARLDASFNRIREFTLHASHELKTPLTVMHGELETTLRDKNDPVERERLLSQLDEVQRLAKVVDGLTLLTKADAGQIALKQEPVRLDDLVRDSHADAQILAQPSNVQVELTGCDNISLLGDRHRLRQLLLNLTDNAVKYNQSQGVVKITLRQVNGSAELQIANTGPGIPPDLQSRVFDRFFRADPSHNNAIDGCGLGLSIAQWIVKAHHGTIEITSKPAELTTVTVLLPVIAN
jgi:signal transduction histidine kinase